MSLSINIQSTYNYDINKFVCECVLDQRIIKNKSQKAKEITELAHVILGHIFINLERIPNIASTISNKSVLLDYHRANEDYFKKVLEIYKNEGTISDPYIQLILDDQIQREKAVLNLNVKYPLSSESFMNKEKKIWKDSFAKISGFFNIQLIKTKEFSNEKKIRDLIKKNNCVFFAFNRINDSLGEILVSSETPKIKLPYYIGPSTSEINLNPNISDPSLTLKIISQLINSGKYEVVSEQKNGDLIMYVDENGDWKHFGVCYDETLVDSKWGGLPIFRHLTDETTYGNSYIIFRPIQTTEKV